MYKIVSHEEYLKLETELGPQVQYYSNSIGDIYFEAINTRQLGEIVTFISALMLENAMNDKTKEHQMRCIAQEEAQKALNKTKKGWF